MKIVYLTQGGYDATLEKIITHQNSEHEVLVLDLAQKNWDEILNQVEQAERVISWTKGTP